MKRIQLLHLEKQSEGSTQLTNWEQLDLSGLGSHYKDGMSGVPSYGGETNPETHFINLLPDHVCWHLPYKQIYLNPLETGSLEPTYTGFRLSFSQFK